MSGAYKEASKLLNQIIYNKVSFKSAVYTKATASKPSKLKCSKTSYATVSETLKFKKVLDKILKFDLGVIISESANSRSKSNNHNNNLEYLLFEKEKLIDGALVYILLYELLIGKFKKIRGGGKVKRCILKYETQLRQVHQLIIRHDNSTMTTTVQFPRYIRINTLKVKYSEAVHHLQQAFGQDKVYRDKHVPDLVVLPASCGKELYKDPYVKNGRLILQDKSSCFSALSLVCGGDLLHSKQPFTVLDATAAPGNKTCHIAALISRQLEHQSPGKTSKSKQRITVLGNERSDQRYKLLQRRMTELVPDDNKFVEVNPIHFDFLKLDPSDKLFEKLRGILLDPSCSGSGIVSQPDRNDDDKDDNGEKEAQRIEALSNFQVTALKHAMSFPQVDFVVYSTCSVHQQENEAVVTSALHEYNANCSSKGEEFVLKAPRCLSNWKRRGQKYEGPDSVDAQCLVRCDGLDGDDTNGFFVSYFERRRVAVQHRNVTEVVRDESLPVYELSSHAHNIDNVKVADKSSINAAVNDDVVISSSPEEEVAFATPTSLPPSPKTKNYKPKKINSIKDKDNIHASKKAKQAKWKQKQSKLRKERLLKKKSNSNASEESIISTKFVN